MSSLKRITKTNMEISSSSLSRHSLSSKGSFDLPAAYHVDSYFRMREASAFMRDGERIVDFVLAYQELRGVNISEEQQNCHAQQAFVRQEFEKQLRNIGLECEHEISEKTTPDGVAMSFVKIHAPYDYLCKMAERLRIKVPITDSNGKYLKAVKPHALKCSSWLKTCAIATKDRPNTLAHVFRAPFDCRRKEMFARQNNDDIFSLADRIRMVWYGLESLTISHPIVSLKSKKHDQAHALLLQNNAAAEDLLSIFVLLKKQVYMAAYPLHDSNYSGNPNMFSDVPIKYLPERYWLYRHWASWTAFRYFQPLDEVARYLGLQCAFYFAWLGMYTKWLVGPTILGLVAIEFGIYQSQTSSPKINMMCDSTLNLYGRVSTICRLCRSTVCPFTSFEKECRYSYLAVLTDNTSISFFAFAICVWFTLFIAMWKRKQTELAVRWGEAALTADLVEANPRSAYLLNVKTKRISPITGEEEVYMLKGEKRRRLCASIGAVLFYILIVLGFLAAVTTYRVMANSIYRKTSKAVDWKSFGVDLNLITSIVASVLNSVIICILSYIYKMIAVWLTDFERLRTEEDYQKSYCYKVFAFEFVNNYSSLFYMGLLKGRFASMSLVNMQETVDLCPFSGCFPQLTVQLIIVFGTRLTLNNIQEVAIPFLKNLWQRKRLSNKLKVQTRTLSRAAQDYLLLQGAEATMYEDYLEMVIQYGYLVMFAAAFPLGPLFALLNNVLEIRVDANKFITEYRRPIPTQVRSIGPWLNILDMLSKLAVVTNSLLIAFTSDDVDRWVYDYLLPHSGKRKDGNETINYDEGLGYLYYQTAVYLTKDIYFSDPMPDKLMMNEYGENVTECSYRGYIYNYWHGPEKAYTLHPTWYMVTLGRLTFIIVFNALVFFISYVIYQRIGDMSSQVRRFVKREQFLVAQRKASMEP